MERSPRGDSPPMRSEGERKAEKFLELGARLRETIGSLEAPLAHGTTSIHLRSVLEHGLGAVMPDNAYAGTKSATDLHEPDGLLGAYAFARFNKEELEITSETLRGEDLISRYAKLNPRIDADQLREKFAKYAEHRKPEGYPVVFIFDGGKETKIAHVNPRVPSEVSFEGELGTERLRMLMVPRSKESEAQALLDELQVKAEIMPVETLECD